MDRLQSSCDTLAVIARQDSAHFERGHHGTLSTIFAGDGCAEDGHHRVTHELVEHAFVAEDSLHHSREVVVKQANDFFRRGFLRDAAEIPDVAEEHRHGLTIATEFESLAISKHSLRYLACNMAAQSAHQPLFLCDVVGNND